MPKTTHAAGGTNALDESYLAKITEGEPSKLEEEGDESSPGTSSTPTSKSDDEPSKKSSSDEPPPSNAPTAGPRSAKTAQARKGASSTAGSRAKTKDAK